MKDILFKMYVCMYVCIYDKSFPHMVWRLHKCLFRIAQKHTESEIQIVFFLEFRETFLGVFPIASDPTVSLMDLPMLWIFLMDLPML